MKLRYMKNKQIRILADLNKNGPNITLKLYDSMAV